MRLRFAPSPTGPPARRQRQDGACSTGCWRAGQGGTFILRIEDTDVERSTAESEAGHPRGPALARPGLGRRARRRRRPRAVPAVGAARPVPLVRERTDRARARVLLLLSGRSSSKPTAARRSRPAGRRSTPAGAVTSPPEAAREPHARGRARRRAVPRAASDRDGDVPGRRARHGAVRDRGHWRSRARAVRRAPRVQLRGRRRRCADGDHARDPGRGPHFEHAAAGAALRGAAVHAAGVRASGARARPRPHAAFEAPRRDVGLGVPAPRATCPRRW